MNWVTFVGGGALFFAPFASGYSGSPAALWTGLIVGVALTILGYMKNYEWATAAGLVPIVDGYHGLSAKQTHATPHEYRW